MEIASIVAVAKNYGIGKNNGLLCHLPQDLKHFKEITTGHTVVMGSNTFYSLPKGALPNRRNIVLFPEEKTFPGCETAHSFPEIMELCKNDEKVFFMGGAMVYRQAMEYVNTLYITWIHHEFEADVFFPEIDMDIWQEVEREDHLEAEPYAFSYVRYVRK